MLSSGGHHYYLGNIKWGVLYTATLGVLGIGWLIDGARLTSLVNIANGRDQPIRDMVFKGCEEFQSCCSYCCPGEREDVPKTPGEREDVPKTLKE